MSALEAIRRYMGKAPRPLDPIPIVERRVTEIVGIKVPTVHVADADEVAIDGDKIPATPDTIITPQNMTRVNQMFNRLTERNIYELEFSLGEFRGDNFVPGISSAIAFNRLIEALSQKVAPTTATDTVYIAEGIRKIVDSDDNVIFQRKIRDKRLFVTERTWGYRITISEEDEDVVINEDEFNPTIERRRLRTSFEYNGVKIDTTRVTQTFLDTNRSYVRYEIEMEATTKTTPEKFVEHIMEIYTLLGDGIAITWQQRQVIAALHNKLFGRKSPRPGHLIENYWSKPQNLDLVKDILIDKNFNPAVTNKYNGERRMLYILDNAYVLLWAPGEMIVVGAGDPEISGTLIDVEYMASDSSLHAFDILFHKGEDVRHLDLAERINRLLVISGNVQELSFYERRSHQRFTKKRAA